MTKVERQRLAAAINMLRPDWPVKSLVTFIEVELAARSYRDAAVALAWIATDADTRTPKRVLEPGPWWSAAPGSPGARPDPDLECDTCHRRDEATCSAAQQRLAEEHRHPYVSAVDARRQRATTPPTPLPALAAALAPDPEPTTTEGASA